MAQSVFAANATQFIDGVDQDFYGTVAMQGPEVVDAVTDEQEFVFATDHYGAQYFHFDTAGCPNGNTLRLTFDPAEAEPFFGQPLPTLGAWAAEFTRGTPSRPVYHYRIVEHEWSVSVVQPFNRIEDVYAITTALEGAMLGHVRLECLFGRGEPGGELDVQQVAELLPGESDGRYTEFGIEVAPALAGLQYYKLRMYPWNAALSHPFELGCMIWI